jgi:hypothetical protein
MLPPFVLNGSPRVGDQNPLRSDPHRVRARAYDYLDSEPASLVIDKDLSPKLYVSYALPSRPRVPPFDEWGC